MIKAIILTIGALVTINALQAQEQNYVNYDISVDFYFSTDAQLEEIGAYGDVNDKNGIYRLAIKKFRSKKQEGVHCINTSLAPFSDYTNFSFSTNVVQKTSLALSKIKVGAPYYENGSNLCVKLKLEGTATDKTGIIKTQVVVNGIAKSGSTCIVSHNFTPENQVVNLSECINKSGSLFEGVSVSPEQSVVGVYGRNGIKELNLIDLYENYVFDNKPIESDQNGPMFAVRNTTFNYYQPVFQLKAQDGMYSESWIIEVENFLF